jgi:hypothetical protein
MRGDVSDRSKINELDGSTVQFVDNEEALKGDNVSNIKSKIGTEKEGVDNTSAIYSNMDGTYNNQDQDKHNREMSGPTLENQ